MWYTALILLASENTHRRTKRSWLNSDDVLLICFRVGCLEIPLPRADCLVALVHTGSWWTEFCREWAPSATELKPESPGHHPPRGWMCKECVTIPVLSFPPLWSLRLDTAHAKAIPVCPCLEKIRSLLLAFFLVRSVLGRGKILTSWLESH